jgi:tryptophan halogenase
VNDRVRSIVIVGGGAAGWMAAATLGRMLKPAFCEVRLIDSPQDNPGAVSQTTSPSFHRLNNLLGINEEDLMRKTRATFRLGVQFLDWGRLGDRYFHTFGSFGASLEAVPFHQHWIKLWQSGERTNIEDYSTATVAARGGRFAHPVLDQRSVLSLYSYAYHFHSELLAAYLSEYAQHHGVVRVAREVVDVQLRGEDGFIEALRLDDGTDVRADLYIDCTGTRGALFERALGSGFVDWTRWLPCDRAVAIPCSGGVDLPPYSQSAACSCGWQWRIPLQGCLDRGYVYSGSFLSDDAAIATLQADLPDGALAEPRLLRFASGRPRRFWTKNCLTLAANSMEPLESTGLHLVQTGITRLLTLFPVRRVSPSDIEEYNRLTIMEHERIRDFLILHYKATTREDAPLWEYCRNMEVPDTLRDRIELFQRCGRLSMLDDEHFGAESWLSLFLGQNVCPQDYDPLADVLEVEAVRAAFSRVSSAIRAAVATLPTHGQFIETRCKAAPLGTL